MLLHREFWDCQLNNWYGGLYRRCKHEDESQNTSTSTSRQEDGMQTTSQIARLAINAQVFSMYDSWRIVLPATKVACECLLSMTGNRMKQYTLIVVHSRLESSSIPSIWQSDNLPNGTWIVMQYYHANRSQDLANLRKTLFSEHCVHNKNHDHLATTRE